ncbi:hypothetical protein BJ508DRAFT_411268 [Ascobolus immersus RN42]|uniref:Uncharacterized protein n=1 Tax=Ascobolus immersus RN42 TaxID=1160509 RepID=A0A3N4IL56_ASCIM|nr:hypothetical protein BJ508DRAFT_411268 [Ascobolus immersus RN42]
MLSALDFTISLPPTAQSLFHRFLQSQPLVGASIPPPSRPFTDSYSLISSSALLSISPTHSTITLSRILTVSTPRRCSIDLPTFSIQISQAKDPSTESMSGSSDDASFPDGGSSTGASPSAKQAREVDYGTFFTSIFGPEFNTASYPNHHFDPDEHLASPEDGYAVSLKELVTDRKPLDPNRLGPRLPFSLQRFLYLHVSELGFTDTQNDDNLSILSEYEYSFEDKPIAPVLKVLEDLYTGVYSPSIAPILEECMMVIIDKVLSTILLTPFTFPLSLRTQKYGRPVRWNCMEEPSIWSMYLIENFSLLFNNLDEDGLDCTVKAIRVRLYGSVMRCFTAKLVFPFVIEQERDPSSSWYPVMWETMAWDSFWWASLCCSYTRWLVHHEDVDLNRLANVSDRAAELLTSIFRQSSETFSMTEVKEMATETVLFLFETLVPSILLGSVGRYQKLFRVPWRRRKPWDYDNPGSSREPSTTIEAILFMIKDLRTDPDLNQRLYANLLRHEQIELVAETVRGLLVELSVLAKDSSWSANYWTQSIEIMAHYGAILDFITDELFRSERLEVLMLRYVREEGVNTTVVEGIRKMTRETPRLGFHRSLRSTIKEGDKPVWKKYLFTRGWLEGK